MENQHQHAQSESLLYPAPPPPPPPPSPPGPPTRPSHWPSLCVGTTALLIYVCILASLIHNYVHRHEPCAWSKSRVFFVNAGATLASHVLLQGLGFLFFRLYDRCVGAPAEAVRDGRATAALGTMAMGTMAMGLLACGLAAAVTDPDPCYHGFGR
ncbi:hypothetical protein MMC34_006813 [Xylographa carneopallida]|nr:hypothetical protein [Xylographa carneopallida]